MWLFLLTEIMFFGGLFMAYLLYRNWYYDAFVAGSNTLGIGLGNHQDGGSDLVQFHHGHGRLDFGARDAQPQGLARPRLALRLSWALVFLGIKTVEYHESTSNIAFLGRTSAWRTLSTRRQARRSAGAGYGQHAQLFFLLYFAMTGHARPAHDHRHYYFVYSGSYGRLEPRRPIGMGNTSTIDNFGLYWHFVDIVWIFLFPLLYLISRHPLK